MSSSNNVMIHALFWNGGLSHVLAVAGENVKIYQILDDTFDWEDTRVDVWLDKIQEEGQKLEFPDFLNQDRPSLELNDVEKSEIFEGSALFHRSNGTFILVEKEVRNIRLLDDDSFHSFQSDMGNSGVPYSFIKGTRYTYILSDPLGSAYPNESFEGSENVYGVFYELVYEREGEEIDRGEAFHSEVIV